MTDSEVQGGGTNAGQQPRVDSDFPSILENTAKVLKEAGCGPAAIRLALLSMCGVPIHPMSLISFMTLE